MSSDDQVFRSSQPHEVSVPAGGADAVGKVGHAGQGDAKEVQATTVFAPLDDPLPVEGARVVPVIEDPLPPTDIPSVAVASNPSSPMAESAEAPPEFTRRPERYRLSGPLLARAAEIRLHTAQLAARIERFAPEA